jgi:KDO2-lipid IV(A) lauroyltransferase
LFPGDEKGGAKSLLQRNFESVGMGVIETGMAWFWPAWRVKKCFTVQGYEHMEKARARGNGVVLVGMHFLTLELGARIFGMLNPGIGVIVRIITRCWTGFRRAGACAPIKPCSIVMI